METNPGFVTWSFPICRSVFNGGEACTWLMLERVFHLPPNGTSLSCWFCFLKDLALLLLWMISPVDFLEASQLRVNRVDCVDSLVGTLVGTGLCGTMVCPKCQEGVDARGKGLMNGLSSGSNRPSSMSSGSWVPSATRAWVRRRKKLKSSGDLITGAELSWTPPGPLQKWC